MIDSQRLCMPTEPGLAAGAGSDPAITVVPALFLVSRWPRSRRRNMRVP